MERFQALVVDRDSAIRAVIGESLEPRGVRTLGASCDAEAIETFKSEPIHLLFVDIDGPPTAGQDLALRSLALALPPLVVGMSSGDDERKTVALIEAGAFDVLRKPIRASALVPVAARCLRQLECLAENRRLRKEIQSREGYHTFVGRTGAMERVRQDLQILASSDAHVWFHGEAGTGKELSARTLHAASSRREFPFVVLGCSRYAQSGGAVPGPAGKMIRPDAPEGPLSQARSGSLYLDEITELPLDAQRELLGFVDRSSAESNGAPRLLAASTLDAATAVAEGVLLKELRGRLADTEVRLPRLRERSEDVVLLARHFISTISEINNLPPIQVSHGAMNLLDTYPWPGNVQELRDAIEYAVILAADGTIRPQDLPERIREVETRPNAGEPLATREFRAVKREVVESFEKAYLCELLERFGGNVTSASRQAGMLRSALQRLLRKYGLRSAEFRKKRRTPSARPAQDRHPD